MGLQRMWPLALALAVMHVATAIVSEPGHAFVTHLERLQTVTCADVDVLDAGLMEAALKNYRRHQLEGSLDSHADLLTSLLEVCWRLVPVFLVITCDR